MKRVAFIIQPLDSEHPYNIFGPEKELLKKMIKPEIMMEAIKYAEPFVYTDNVKINSITNAKIEGFVVIYPYFPIELFKEDKKVATEKLFNACQLAEREGADIIVLSSFTSMLANEGKDIANSLRINVTSGENYLAATVLQGIEKAISFMEINPKIASVAILGATTNVGQVCSQKLADFFNEIRIYSPNSMEVDVLEKKIKARKRSVRVIKARDSKEAAKDAKVVLVTTSPYTIRMQKDLLEPGSIVCDIAIPPRIAKDLMDNRPDILSFDGRFAEMEIEIESEKWHRMFPRGVIFSRLAEAIILSFESAFCNYSLGKETITVDKVDRIKDMARRHGFKTAAFRMGMEKFSKSYLNSIKEKANNYVFKNMR